MSHEAASLSQNRIFSTAVAYLNRSQAPSLPPESQPELRSGVTSFRWYEPQAFRFCSGEGRKPKGTRCSDVATANIYIYTWTGKPTNDKQRGTNTRLAFRRAPGKLDQARWRANTAVCGVLCASRPGTGAAVEGEWHQHEQSTQDSYPVRAYPWRVPGTWYSCFVFFA